VKATPTLQPPIGCATDAARSEPQRVRVTLPATTGRRDRKAASFGRRAPDGFRFLGLRCTEINRILADALAVSFLDDHICCIAGNAVGKDSHERRAVRKAFHRKRSEACIRPAVGWIDRGKDNLAVVDAAQLRDRVIAR
jgi:hypothetical protein